MKVRKIALIRSAFGSKPRTSEYLQTDTPIWCEKNCCKGVNNPAVDPFCFKCKKGFSEKENWFFDNKNYYHFNCYQPT